jgi:formamidopyrimidine-DNA glycosylase
LRKHEHFDLEAGGKVMRYTDPRRFGALLWHAAAAGPVERHPLLAGLGVEPLTPALSAQLLHRATRGRKVSIKQALLAGDIVVGVGNIYASESLFRARINPKTAAGRVSLGRFERLVPQIRDVLSAAIAKGDYLTVDSAGRGVKTTTDKYPIIGMALAASTAQGDIIPIMLMQFNSSL